jgi:hypothetical protein
VPYALELLALLALRGNSGDDSTKIGESIVFCGELTALSVLISTAP